MEEKNIINIIGTLYRQIYYKDEWGIASIQIDDVLQGDPAYDKNKCIVLKGIMPTLKRECQYNIMAEEIDDDKFGKQYNIISLHMSVPFDLEDVSKQKIFLEALFTPKQVAAMYEALPNPFIAFKEEDVVSLVSIKGCGMKNAVRWLNKFQDAYKIGLILTELKDYHLTNVMVNKLIDKYKSPELIVEKVKNNPYILCTEVQGIGWKTADNIALKGNMDPFSTMRIGAYIQYYLEQRSQAGYSWVEPDELLGAIIDVLGEDVPDSAITESIHELEEVLWWNDDKTRIGLQKYYLIEYKVAKELIRLRDAESYIEDPDDVDSIIQRLEFKQGWNFTEEQIEGLFSALNFNVTLIQGCAGTGKSSLVSGVLEVLKDYTYVQCALSGRAASRMSEITGEEGYTIHRLLGYPKGEPSKQGFLYHDENPLLQDIYILDEISMVDLYLFYDLLRAIPTGSKLICLGDPGQLESIGCGNVAHDMAMSGEIPLVTLTQIHRQAAASAIITESLRIRHGHQIVQKDWAGEEVRGELQDLCILGYSDSSNTFYKIMEQFNRAITDPKFDLMETQVIVPLRNRGDACTYTLNNAMQELYNPEASYKNEIVIFNAGQPYILREGDKVINVKNSYTTDPPIFNGNLGVIKEINNQEEYMIIDFIGIGEVTIEKKLYSNIELGYAITVHKAQGSQWNKVIFGIDFSSYALLTRELIYTGITRAKKDCVLITQTNALRFATGKESVSTKTTHLQQCLYDICHPKLIF